MHNQAPRHESVPSTNFEFKKHVVARAESANFSRQKVRDVVEESTTNNRREHTEYDTVHPIAAASFHSCLVSAFVVRDQKVRDVIEESTTDKWQQQMADGATHLAGLFAFLSCVSSAEVQK